MFNLAGKHLTIRSMFALWTGPLTALLRSKAVHSLCVPEGSQLAQNGLLISEN